MTTNNRAINRTLKKSDKTDTKVNTIQYKCFKCDKEQNDNNYYLSYSKFFHHVPICKKCLGTLFDHYTEQYMSTAKAMIQICSIIDMYYSKKVLDDSINYISGKNGENVAILGNYVRKINSLPNYQGFTFKDSDIQNKNANIDDISTTTITEDVVKWGSNYTTDDYIYLNAKYNEWCVSSPHDLQSDITNIRDICKQELITAKDPSNTKAIDLKVKLIKMGGFDGASLRKNEKDTTLDKELGCIIAMMEKETPADHYDDPEKYKDYLGRDEYYKQNYIRPMRNICTGKKDFPKVK